MVHGFAKQSHGHVSIYSEIDKGTTVSIYLPRTREDATEDIDSEVRRRHTGAERILVIEDDEFVREIPVSYLRDQGYDVTEATNGKEAIRCLQDDGPFDLLFTDLVLPGGMTGMEIAQEARQLQPNIKVLYATGYTEEATIRSGPLAKVETIIRKPYEIAALGKAIRTVFENSD